MCYSIGLFPPPKKTSRGEAFQRERLTLEEKQVTFDPYIIDHRTPNLRLSTEIGRNCEFLNPIGFLKYQI